MKKLTQNIPAGGTISFPSCKTFVFLRSSTPVSFKFITLYNRIDRQIENFKDTFSVTADTYFLRVEVHSEEAQELSCILIEDTKIDYTPITGDVFISNDESHKVNCSCDVINDREDAMLVRNYGSLFQTVNNDFSLNHNGYEDCRFQHIYIPLTGNPNFQAYNLQLKTPTVLGVDYRVLPSIYSLEITPTIDTKLLIITPPYNQTYIHLPNVYYNSDLRSALKQLYPTRANTQGCLNYIKTGYNNLSALPAAEDYDVIYSYSIKQNTTEKIKFDLPFKVEQWHTTDYVSSHPSFMITTKDACDFEMHIDLIVHDHNHYHQDYNQGNE